MADHERLDADNSNARHCHMVKLLRWLGILPPPLSPAIIERLNVLFPNSTRRHAASELAWLGSRATELSRHPDDLERTRFAVLKLSDGDLDQLADWISEARQDFRGVLLAAGFARDVQSHLQWFPRGRGLDPQTPLREPMP